MLPACSLDALRALMTADVKCLVVNLPHNPSGWLPSRQQWSDIVDCARQVGQCSNLQQTSYGVLLTTSLCKKVGESSGSGPG
jgi:hypothetical protein